MANGHGPDREQGPDDDPLFSAFNAQGGPDPDQDPLFSAFPSQEPETVEGGRLPGIYAAPPPGRERPTQPETPPEQQLIEMGRGRSAPDPSTPDSGMLPGVSAAPPPGRERPERSGRPPEQALLELGRRDPDEDPEDPEIGETFSHPEIQALWADAMRAEGRADDDRRGIRSGEFRTVAEAAGEQTGSAFGPVGRVLGRALGEAGAFDPAVEAARRILGHDDPEFRSPTAHVSIPDRFNHAANRFVQGAAGLPASAYEGLAILEHQLREATDTLPPGEEVADLTKYKFAQQIKSWAKETFREHPDLEEAFWSSDVPGALGSFGSFIGLGVATAPLGGPASLGAVTTAAGLSGSSQAYGEAVQAGASHDDAIVASRWGILPGVIQVFPVMRAVDRALGRIPAAAGSRLLNSWKEGAKGAFEEGVAEALGAAGFGLIRQHVHGAEVDYMEALWDAAGPAGVAGFLTSALFGLRTGGPGRAPGTGTDVSPAPPPRPSGRPGELPEVEPAPTPREGPDVDEAVTGAQEGAPEGEEVADIPEWSPSGAPTPVDGERILPRQYPDGRPVNPTRVEGASSDVVLADGRRLPVRYALTSLSETAESHDPVTFQQNPDFPPGIQDRRYHADRVARDEVASRAVQLDPDILLDPTNRATDGPAILRQDGVTLSGNQRHMLIRRAAELHPNRYQDYLQRIVERALDFGMDQAQVATAIEDAQSRGEVVALDRVLDGDLIEGRAELADLMGAFNTTATKSRDALGEAQVQARRLAAARGPLQHFAETIDTDQTIRSYLDSAGGRDFLQQLVQSGVIPRQEASRYMDSSTGFANTEGKNLVERMMLSAAVQDAEVIDRAPASWLQRIEKAVPAIIETQDNPQWDITETLRGALDLGATMRASDHRTVDALTSQIDLTGREFSPEVESLARFIEDKSPTEVSSALREYARFSGEARAQAESHDMFGQEPVSQSETFNRLFGDEGEGTRTQGAETQTGEAALAAPAAGSPQQRLAELRGTLLEGHPELESLQLFYSERGLEPTVELARIEVAEEARGRGTGTRVLREITRWADQEGLPIWLQVENEAPGQGTALREWYGQHGFVPNRGRTHDPSLSRYADMYRMPEGSADSQVSPLSPEGREALIEEIAQDLYGLEWGEFIDEAAPATLFDLLDGAATQAIDGEQLEQIRGHIQENRQHLSDAELAELEQSIQQRAQALGEDGPAAATAPLEVQDDLLGGPPTLTGEQQRTLFPESSQQTLSEAEAQARRTVERLKPLIDADRASVAQMDAYRESLALLRREETLSGEEMGVRARQIEREQRRVKEKSQGELFLAPRGTPSPESTATRSVQPWQQTREDFAGPIPTDGDVDTFDQWRDRERIWEQRTLEAVAEGKLTPEEARERGLKSLPENTQPLPTGRPLYHVTTARTAVLDIGLRTRAQLNMDRGTGLGGGDNTTVSFTTNRDLANDIRDALLLARSVFRGDTTVEQLLEEAQKGEGADGPWIEDLIRGWKGDWSFGDQLPEPIRLLLDGEVRETVPGFAMSEADIRGKGWRPLGEGWQSASGEQLHNAAARPGTPAELRQSTAEFFRRWMAWREDAGGPTDPLFFLNDTEGLANVSPSEISVLEVRPRPRAVGHPMAGMNEWRTHSGRAVEVTRADGRDVGEFAEGITDKGWANKKIREQLEDGGGTAEMRVRASEVLPDVQRLTPEGSDKRPPSISEIREDMEKVLGVPIGTGRLRKLAKAFGLYQIQPETVRVRMANDLTTISHEIGHHLHKLLFTRSAPDFRPRSPLAGLDESVLEPWADELGPLAQGVSNESLTEGWAEFWRRWLTNKEMAARRAPKLWQWVQNEMPQRDPALWDALNRWQSMAEEYVAASATARVSSRIAYGEGRWEKIVKAGRRGLDRAYQEVVDRFSPMEDMQRELEMLRWGDPIDKITSDVRRSPKVMSDLIAGAKGMADHFINRAPVDGKNGVPRDDVPSLREALDPVRDNLEQFETYVVAKRTLHLQTARDIDQGFETSDLRATMRELEGKHPEFVQAAEDVHAYQEALLDYMVDGGVITKETQEAFREGNPFYVPLFKVRDEVQHGSGERGSGGRDHIFSPFKRIGSSGRDIVSPIESIIKNTFFYTELVQKQRAQEALADLANAHGAGRFLTPIEPSAVIAARVKKGEITDWMRRQIADELGHERVGKEFFDQIEELIPELFLVMRPGDFFGQENVISHLVTTKDSKTGKMKQTRQWYEVRDLDIYRALTHNPDAGNAAIVRAGALPAATLRAGATTDPAFLLRNPFRDQLVALTQSNFGFTPGIDLARGIFHLIGKTDTYWQWKRSGGEFATLVDMDRRAVLEAWRKMSENPVPNVVLHPLQLLQAIGAVTENATRIAEYTNALRAGGEKQGIIRRWMNEMNPQWRREAAERMQEPDGALTTLAAWHSREISTQYSTHGASDSIQILRMLSTFWNARIQSYDRLFRAFKEDPVGAGLRAFAGITLPTMMLYAMNREDEEYWELPQWQRDWHWMIKVPNLANRLAPDFLTSDESSGLAAQLAQPFVDTGETMWLRFPIPWELGLVFKTFPERLMEWADTRDPEGLKESLRSSISQQVSGTLMPIPTFAEPIIENYFNYSLFMQRSLDPDWEEADPTLIQRPGTSDVAKGTVAMFKRLGLYNLPGAERTFGSPQKIDNIIYGYTGGLGRTGVDLADRAARTVGITERGGGRPTTMHDMPVIRGFTARNPGLSSESVQRFRRKWGEIRQSKATIDMLEREERWDQLDKEMEDPEVQRHLDDYSYFNSINQEINGLWSEAAEIERDTFMTNGEKVEAIERLGQVAIELAREAIDRKLPDDDSSPRR